MTSQEGVTPSPPSHQSAAGTLSLRTEPDSARGGNFFSRGPLAVPRDRPRSRPQESKPALG